MDAQAHVFFSGRYTYRKPPVLAASILALAFGGYTLRYLVLAGSHTVWNIQAFGASVFVGGIGGILVICGLIFLKRWFTQTTVVMEISSEGIRYGNNFHSWDKIHWLSGQSDRKKVQLFYQTLDRGLAGFDRPLPSDHNLTPEEYANLMNTIRNAISSKYPDVIIG